MAKQRMGWQPMGRRTEGRQPGRAGELPIPPAIGRQRLGRQPGRSEPEPLPAAGAVHFGAVHFVRPLRRSVHLVRADARSYAGSLRHLGAGPLRRWTHAGDTGDAPVRLRGRGRRSGPEPFPAPGAVHLVGEFHLVRHGRSRGRGAGRASSAAARRC